MSSSHEKSEDKNLKNIGKIITGIAFVAMTQVLIYFYFFYDGARTQETFAQFGDFFGGILNPILTFLTVVLLLHSIRVQSAELVETRKEITETKNIHRDNLVIARENIRSQENLYFVQLWEREILATWMELSKEDENFLKHLFENCVSHSFFNKPEYFSEVERDTLSKMNIKELEIFGELFSIHLDQFQNAVLKIFLSANQAEILKVNYFLIPSTPILKVLCFAERVCSSAKYISFTPEQIASSEKIKHRQQDIASRIDDINSQVQYAKERLEKIKTMTLAEVARF